MLGPMRVSVSLLMARVGLAGFGSPAEVLEGLPLLPLTAILGGSSSHDREGLNEDGFQGAWSSLGRDEAGRYVLLDASGPGLLQRMWFTDLSTAGRLLIF